MASASSSVGDIGSQWTTSLQAGGAQPQPALQSASKSACHSGDQWRGPDDQCETDLSILGTLVHGKTSAETNGAGQRQHAEVRLPVKLSINTPKGVQPARLQARVGMPHRVFSPVKILGWILRDGDLHGVRWNTLGHLRQEPPPF
jgi:hypothetical protein